MPQDRRTNAFKKDRERRLKSDAPLRVPISEDQIIARQPHIETPDRCIWCDFPLNGLYAVCPNCHNCQSCGLLNGNAGLESCYLCGNYVPSYRLQEPVPDFRTNRGRGFVKKTRDRLLHRRGPLWKGPGQQKP